MTRFNSFISLALILARAKHIAASSRLDPCISDPSRVTVSYSTSQANTTAPASYFYNALTSLQHHYFLTGDSTFFQRTPYCWKGSAGTWLPATLTSFPHTRDVYTDRHGHTITVNESEKFDQRIWITSFEPFHHYIEPPTSPGGNYTETLEGRMWHDIVSWESGADNHGHIYHTAYPELTMERVESVINRCDACSLAQGRSDGRCNFCCSAGNYPWYCGIGTLDQW